MDTSTFNHRFKTDGTVDSICKHCFATIATAHSELDLKVSEWYHTCAPEALSRYSIDRNESKDPEAQTKP